MTEQKKQILLQDICARLPYHVRVKVWLEDGDTEEGPLDLQHNYGDVLLDAFYYKKITKIKPYLRPMSSMTEDEKKQYQTLTPIVEVVFEDDASRLIDWLNAHHFDYRGLVEKGLALKAPKGMYKTKTE